jgi:hypothetical protein
MDALPVQTKYFYIFGHGKGTDAGAHRKPDCVGKFPRIDYAAIEHPDFLLQNAHKNRLTWLWGTYAKFF